MAKKIRRYVVWPQDLNPPGTTCEFPEVKLKKVVLASDYDALAARLAEAERLLRLVSDENWDVTGGYPLLNEVDAFLAANTVTVSEVQK